MDRRLNVPSGVTSFHFPQERLTAISEEDAAANGPGGKDFTH